MNSDSFFKEDCHVPTIVLSVPSWYGLVHHLSQYLVTEPNILAVYPTPPGRCSCLIFNFLIFIDFEI